MRIREEIVKKHWHDAAVAELSSKYAQQGYEIYKDAPIGEYWADLVAKKDREILVFQVKSGDWSTEKTRQVQQARNEVVHRLGGQFTLVLAPLPQEKSIEIEAIETILHDALVEEPGDLDELSTRTTIENVTEVFIRAISVGKKQIRVTGSGLVEVSLAWGSGMNDSSKNSDTYSFDFEVLLGSDLNLIAVEKLAIDLPVYAE